MMLPLRLTPVRVQGYNGAMDAPKKRRCRFGLRTLLTFVGLVGIGLSFRPGQVNPKDVPVGATKAWVYWNCGRPDEPDKDDWWSCNWWWYEKPTPSYNPFSPAWNVWFDSESERVESIDDFASHRIPE